MILKLFISRKYFLVLIIIKWRSCATKVSSLLSVPSDSTSIVTRDLKSYLSFLKNLDYMKLLIDGIRVKILRVVKETKHDLLEEKQIISSYYREKQLQAHLQGLG